MGLAGRANYQGQQQMRGTASKESYFRTTTYVL